jgi:GT2 family glycosyltransferase
LRLVIGVIVLNWNTRDLLLECLATVAPVCEANGWTCCVVDNASNDDSVPAVRREYPGVTVYALDENVGFARANNVAAAMLIAARPETEFLYFANADTRLIAADSLAVLAEVARRTEGIVAPRLLNVDGTLQPSVAPFSTLLPALAMNAGLARLAPDAWRPFLGTSWSHGCTRRVPWIKGAALMLSRALWEELGGFSEAEFMYAEDMDISWRAQRIGAPTTYVRDVAVIHHDDAASSQIWTDADRAVRVASATRRFVERELNPFHAQAVRCCAVAGAALRMCAFRILGRRPELSVYRAVAAAWLW